MKRRDVLKSMATAGAVALLPPGAAGLETVPVGRTKPIEILTNHYTWYSLPWSDKANTVPLRGYYDSTDLAVIEAQNKEKNFFGLTTDCVSWWGPEAPSFLKFQEGYLKAANFRTRQFCFGYQIAARLRQSSALVRSPRESLGRLDPSGRPIEGIWKKKYYFDFADPYNRDTFLSDIEFLGTYFGEENYHRIDGRPVIYIWLDNLKNFGNVSRQVRRKVYLIGSEPILFPPEPSETERLDRPNWYDAITCYGINPVVVAKTYRTLNADFLAEYTRCVRTYVWLLKTRAPETKLLLPVQFTYHDNRGNYDPKDGRCRVLTCEKEEGPAFLDRVRSLFEEVPRITGILVTSYNEHYEGTAVEPNIFKGVGGQTIGYGSRWLINLKKYFKPAA
jgi:hypothetical protein